VGPPGRSGRDQLVGVRKRLEERQPGPGELVLVACDKGAAGAISGRGEGLEDTIIHSVSCVGSLHSSVIESYLRAGAAGVMVAACPARDCWNREGGKWAAQRMFHERGAELQARVDRNRVHLASAGEGDRQPPHDESRAYR